MKNGSNKVCFRSHRKTGKRVKDNKRVENT